MADIVVSSASTAGTRANSVIDEGGWITTVARVTLPNGALLTQAAVASITLRVFMASSQRGWMSGEEVCASSTLLASNVVFDTLQTDGWWQVDLAGSKGYNFRHTVQLGVAPWNSFDVSGGAQLRIEYTADTSAYGLIRLINNVTVREVMSP